MPYQMQENSRFPVYLSFLACFLQKITLKKKGVIQAGADLGFSRGGDYFK